MQPDNRQEIPVREDVNCPPSLLHVNAVSGPIKGIGFDSNGGGFASISIGDREFSADEVRRDLSPQTASTALVERLTKALEDISNTRCVHDMGFDREIGPLGCSLGDKCVCAGLCTIASRALLETHPQPASAARLTTSADEIWIEPNPPADPSRGQDWSETNAWGQQATKYVRADIAETLLKALEPFAKEADKFDPIENDDHFLTWGTTFTIGDLRRARAALASSTSREGESR